MIELDNSAFAEPLVSRVDHERLGTRFDALMIRHTVCLKKLVAIIFKEFFDNLHWRNGVEERHPWMHAAIGFFERTKDIWSRTPIACYHFAPMV